MMLILIREVSLGDVTSLFLGSAFMAVGLMVAAVAFLRRRSDPLMISLAMFALLFGLRFWLRSALVPLALPSAGSRELGLVIDYVVPLPALWFFVKAGYFGKSGWMCSLCLAILLGCLVVGTLVQPTPIFGRIYDFAMVVSSFIALSAFFLRRANPPGSQLVRGALFLFILLVFTDNVSKVFFGTYLGVGTYGFALFLGVAGYVTIGRAVSQERQLVELQSELEIAQRIQRSLLPSGFPQSQYFRVAARYQPVTSVAGDFYDYVITNGTRVGLLIADVSGHGVPAALIASMVKLAAVSQKEAFHMPAQLMLGMNRILCGNTQGQLITAAYVYLDAGTSEMLYSAAAHPAMLVLRRGEVSEVVENGLMLAAFEFATYTTANRSLEAGDRILLYTDGLIEAENDDGIQFGTERLCAALQASFERSEEEAADDILRAVEQWSPKQDDDRTLVICDCLRSTSA